MPTHIVAVAGLVKDGKGNVLLGKSVWRKGWEFFGGQVETGENLEEALLREIKEESGVIAKVVSLAGIYSNTKEYKDEEHNRFITTKLMLDFVCEYVSGTPTDSDETEDVMWVPISKAIELVKEQPLQMRLENLLNYEGTVTYRAYETSPYIELFKRNF